MKRFLTILTILSLLIGAVSSCSGTSNENNDEPDIKQQYYAADSLLGTDGSLGNDSKGTLRVGFIGGSLTDGESYTTAEGYAFGGKKWTTALCRYLENLFPNRQIIANNAGIAGTSSELGAFRIEHTIYDYDPDIVFIEYTVNDHMLNYDRKASQIYMEAMVRMAQSKQKIPVVIFLYTPYPIDNSSDTYATWKQGVDWKQEIADYYGLGSINIYDYMQREFKKSNFDVFTDFLLDSGTYKSGWGDASEYYSDWEVADLDVHGGYAFYAEAIIDALENRPADFFGHPEIKQEWFENGAYCDSTYTHYHFIEFDDERLVYNGNWTLYNLSNAIVAPEYFELSGRHDDDYPVMQPGKWKNMMATTVAGASITFTTDADAIFCNSQGVSEEYNMTASVYVDGEYIRSFSCGMHSLIVTLDGQSHEIKIVTDETDKTEKLFWSANYVEAYMESK